MLTEFIQSHEIDAALLNETHLKSSIRLTAKNFGTYRTDMRESDIKQIIRRWWGPRKIFQTLENNRWLNEPVLTL